MDTFAFLPNGQNRVRLAFYATLHRAARFNPRDRFPQRCCYFSVTDQDTLLEILESCDALPDSPMKRPVGTH